MDVGHSALLKFVLDLPKITMSEHKTDSPAIESEVPTLQKLRNVDDAREMTITTQNNSKIAEENNIVETGDYADQSSTKDPETVHNENKIHAEIIDIDEEKYISTDKHENFTKPKEESKYENVSETSSASKEVEFFRNDKEGNKSKFEEEKTATSDDNFVYSPVITVTKEETALTKGDLKLQKVIVSEDISPESSFDNNSLRVTQAQGGKHTLVSEVLPVSIRTNSDGKSFKEKGADDQKVSKHIQTKIPRLRLKQVVERVKEENQKKRHKRDAEVISAQKRRSSIPKVKDNKNSQQDIKKEIVQEKEIQELESPILDDEFDKIYEEIIENEATANIPSLETIRNPLKLESKFEEIIHSYDVNNVQPISMEKPKSKIPLLKRKSDQEIEIPPPSQSKDSLKRSNTEDFKGKIPVAITKEKSLKSNTEPAKNETKSSNEIISEVKKEVIPNKNVESSNKTISVKTVITQTSVDTKDYAKTLPSAKVAENLEKDYNTISKKNDMSAGIHNNNYKIRTITTQTSFKSEGLSTKEKASAKYTSECKIPTSSKVKTGFENKINSATLNKQTTGTNVAEGMSQTTTYKTDRIRDEKMEQSQPLAATQNFKSSSIVLQADKLIKQEKDSSTKIIGNKVEIDKTMSFLQQEIRSMEAERNINPKHNDIRNESKTQKSESPLTKAKILTNIAKEEEIISQSHLESGQFETKTSDSCKSFDELKKMPEKLDLNKTVPKDNFPITQIHTPITSEMTNQSKTTDVSQVKSANKETTRQTSIVKNKDDILSTLRNESKENVGYKQDFGQNRELTETHSSVKGPKASIGLQETKNNTDTNNNDFSTDSEKPTKLKQGSKEAKKYDSNPTTNKIEMTLSSPTKRIVNESNSIRKLEPNTKKVTSNNILPEKQNISIPSQKCENLNKSLNTSDIQIPKEPIDTKKSDANQNIEEENRPKIDDTSINLEEKAEEEIITLRGKVSRVIKRLDSKDHKIVKKEIDDLPKEVKLDIAAKIAIFEKTESDILSKEIESNDVHVQEDAVNDKPKIVNELLKTDINQNDIDINHHKDTYSQKNEITSNKSNFVVDKVSKIGSNSDLQTNNNLEGIKQRTESNVENNEVFVKKDKEDASLEIWKEYRRKKEQDSDMRRARSLAELDLGDAVRGRVREMVVRMSSVDRGHGTSGAGEGRARLRGGGSVSQRIALYEGKLTPIRREEIQRSRSRHYEGKSTDQLRRTEEAKPSFTPGISEEELRRRVEELRSAVVDYGRVETVAYVELCDGGRMPALALGTALLEPALVEHVISAGIELGYRAIDAAYIYGNEQEVGRAINSKIRDGTVTRSELFIINKLWSTFHRRDLVEKACRQSLQAMGLDYFDLYLVHNPMSFKEGGDPLPRIANVLQYSQHDYLEAWYGVEGLVRAGLVRRAGLSNFNSHQVERVVEKGKIKPVVNQVESHPYLTQHRLEEFCLSRNVKLSCFGVLGSKGTPGDLTSGLPPAIDDPLVQVMAAGLGGTPAQLLISYQLSLGRGVVVKCSSARHLAEALAVTSSSGLAVTSPALPLQASHVAALSALNRNKRIFTFRGMGDTHRNYPFKIPF